LENEKALTRFYGNEDWRSAKDEEELVELYKEQIRAVKTIDGRRRGAIDNLTIRGDDGSALSYRYDIIFAAPETRSKNPWFWNLLQYLKQKVSKYTGETIKRALDILAGRSTQIDWFFPKKHLTLDEFIDRRGKGGNDGDE